MAQYNSAVITTAGNELLASAIGTGTFTWTRIATGDGTYSGSEDIESMTALVDEKDSFPISKVTKYAENITKVTANIVNTSVTVGYDITEIGIFGKLDDGDETLIAVIVATDPEYLPAYATSPVTIIHEYYMTITSTTSISMTAEVPADVYAAASDVEALGETVDGKLDSDGGDSASVITSFTSSDVNDGSATSWTNVSKLTSRETHASIFSKTSKMFKNLRYLYKILGTTDISSIGSGDVTSALSEINENVGNAIRRIAVGTCDTEASEQTKVVTLDDSDWELKIGAFVAVKFTYSNTYSTTESSQCYLNVNGTGARQIYYNQGVNTGANTKANGYAGRYNTYVYDGTYWVWVSQGNDENTTYTPQKLGFGYGTCSTAASTLTKVVTLSDYALVNHGIVAVEFAYAVPASATLNINSKGAKSIYYKGAVLTAGVINAGDVATFVYTGSYYILISVDSRDGKDSKSEITTFTSSDVADGSASSWTTVSKLVSGETHASIFGKVSQMFKNLRYLYKLLGTADISSLGDGDVTSALMSLNNDISTNATNISANTDAISTLNDNFKKILCGHTGSIAVSANGYTDVDVTFSTTYSSTPIAVASIKSTGIASNFKDITVSCYDQTTSGFKIRIYNGTSSRLDLVANWIAVFTMTI